jgi:hypothetical protein
MQANVSKKKSETVVTAAVREATPTPPLSPPRKGEGKSVRQRAAHKFGRRG